MNGYYIHVRKFGGETPSPNYSTRAEAVDAGLAWWAKFDVHDPEVLGDAG